MASKRQRKNKISSFVQKLYDMLQDPNSKGIIQWDIKKKGFGVSDLQKFTNVLLPKYFKHSNMESFTRQLSMYNFRKVWSVDFKLFFCHQFFNIEQPNKFNKIKRKKELKKSFQEDCSSQSQQVSLNQIDKLNKQANRLSNWCLKKIKQNQTALKQIQRDMQRHIAQTYNSQFIKQIQQLLYKYKNSYDEDKHEKEQIPSCESQSYHQVEDELLRKALRLSYAAFEYQSEQKIIKLQQQQY